jgi:hypothetical protein
MPNTALARKWLTYEQRPIIFAWVLINIVDTVLTCIALNMGASEMGAAYRMTGSLLYSTILKYLAVLLIAGIVVQIRRLRWLNYFVFGMLFVVSWNLAQIVSNI